LLAAVALAFNPPAALVQGLRHTDVVRRYGISSYRTMVAALPRPPAATGDDGWIIDAPDGGAAFSWRPVADGWLLSMILPAQPFLDAGLDPARLPDGVFQDGRIVLTALARTGGGGDGAVESFVALIEANRDRLGYHEELDHFEVSIGGGSRFEWARDIDANDKDLVFVVDPHMLLAAGVDRDNVAGWVYGSVYVADEYGRSVPEEKFLKPFNLR
ncbi:MAG: hypothetical protein LIP77_11105, partial [Planctomycetes bacterium]|nr:hypothetical protein [Planctomycetota bacterium]